MLTPNRGLVEDSKLKVYGTLNLWIVDPSILPLRTRGNIQTTFYVYAEFVSIIIEYEYHRQLLAERAAAYIIYSASARREFNISAIMASNVVIM